MGELVVAVLLVGIILTAGRVVARGEAPGVRSLRPARHQPVVRPIEAIAADLRRLGRRWHSFGEGARFAKVEGYRRAYDAVLLEACRTLGVTTLIGVLAPGDQLDAERGRVERALSAAGLDVENAGWH